MNDARYLPVQKKYGPPPQHAVSVCAENQGSPTAAPQAAHTPANGHISAHRCSVKTLHALGAAIDANVNCGGTTRFDNCVISYQSRISVVFDRKKTTIK